MLVVRMLLVVEDCVHGCVVSGHGVQPSVDVLRLDVDYGSVVACGGDLRLRIVSGPTSPPPCRGRYCAQI